MKRSDGRAVPLLALAAMDASLRQACRYRVSSYRRRETQELPHRARRAWVGSHPVLAHFSEILPEDHVVAVAAEVLEGPPQARTNGDDASGGRRWCSGRRRRGGGAANGRGRPDTAKPTTTTPAKLTTGSLVDRVRAREIGQLARGVEVY